MDEVESYGVSMVLDRQRERRAGVVLQRQFAVTRARAAGPQQPSGADSDTSNHSRAGSMSMSSAISIAISACATPAGIVTSPDVSARSSASAVAASASSASDHTIRVDVERAGDSRTVSRAALRGLRVVRRQRRAVHHPRP